MEIMLDTANLEKIKSLIGIFPVSGITTNPSILKKEGEVDFYNHMNEIRSNIGNDSTLHIQVIGTTSESIIRDAENILNNIDEEVYIKIPMNKEGMKAIKYLKSRGVKITATAVYSTIQAYLAIGLGCEFIAPYYNRMENMNIDSKAIVRSISQVINKSNSDTKILAASFKNISQVTSAIESGAHAVTISLDVVDQIISQPIVDKAINDFVSDWEDIYGLGQTISNL